MARRPATEDHLQLLRQLRPGPANDAWLKQLSDLLRRPALHGTVIRIAATLALDHRAVSLAPLLESSATSLMGADAAKRDPGCEAKVAIAKALIDWESDFHEFFLALAPYRQMEMTFGDPIDTAPECRGLAAVAIARLRPPDALNWLVDLLADENKITRVHAAMALGMWRGVEALPVLRLKARVGDAEAEVLGEVFSSLLRHSPREQLAFVTAQLASLGPRNAEAAALALGQSRIPEALAPLTRAWDRLRRTPIANSLLLAISLHRSDESVTWLIDTLAKVRPAEGATIIDALILYKADAKVRRRLAAAVAGNAELQKTFDEVFGK